MAVVKIKKIYKTLKTAIEYISNPDKTRDGLLCSSNCGLPTVPESVYAGMRTTEADALAEGARRGKILAYHVIQSFLPGEIEAEEAHRLGVEFLHKILGGEDEYNYTISTHTDRGHIHNHIIFHPRNTRTHKYYEMKRSAPRDYRRISNEITSREGYSRTYEWNEKDWESAPSKTLGGILAEAKPNSKKAKLSAIIDHAITSAFSWESFEENLKDHEITITRSGKSILFNAPQLFKRPLRGSTLGAGFTEIALAARIGRIEVSEVIIQKKFMEKINDEFWKVQLPHTWPDTKFITIADKHVRDYDTHYRMYLPKSAEYRPVNIEGHYAGEKINTPNLFNYFSRTNPFENINFVDDMGHIRRGHTKAQQRYFQMIDQKVSDLSNQMQVNNLFTKYITTPISEREKILDTMKDQLSQIETKIIEAIIERQQALDHGKDTTASEKKLSQTIEKKNTYEKVIAKINARKQISTTTPAPKKNQNNR